MDHDTTTEQRIKARMERIVPSRALFAATMARVTNAQMKRSTTMKAVPSPYVSFVSIVTTRSAQMGMSVALVAFIVVFAMKSGDFNAFTGAHQANQEQPASGPVTSHEDDVSADQIVATLIDDANSEATSGAGEEDDGTALTQDVENYTII
jgi:hypothetical protein